MKLTFPWTLVGLLLMPVLFTACNETTREDVQAARENVIDQQHEAERTADHVNQEIAEQKIATEEARREALKPIISESDAERIRNEEAKLKETIEEGRQEIKDKQAETLQAQQELNETAREVALKEERDAYTVRIEEKLKAADKEIESLEDQGADLEDTAKDNNDLRIKTLKDRRERVSDALSTLKNADLLKWKDSQELVERALRDLDMEMKRGI